MGVFLLNINLKSNNLSLMSNLCLELGVNRDITDKSPENFSGHLVAPDSAPKIFRES